MKQNWNFLGGEWVQNEKPSMGRVWISSRNTHSKSVVEVLCNIKSHYVML